MFVSSSSSFRSGQVIDHGTVYPGAAKGDKVNPATPLNYNREV